MELYASDPYHSATIDYYVYDELIKHAKYPLQVQPSTYDHRWQLLFLPMGIKAMFAAHLKPYEINVTTLSGTRLNINLRYVYDR